MMAEKRKSSNPCIDGLLQIFNFLLAVRECVTYGLIKSTAYVRDNDAGRERDLFLHRQVLFHERCISILLTVLIRCDGYDRNTRLLIPGKCVKENLQCAQHGTYDGSGEMLQRLQNRLSY